MHPYRRLAAAAATALALTLGLTGCATSPGGMREDADARRTVQLDLPYQLVLKRIVDRFDECTPAPMLPIGSAINNVSHYPDLRQASIVRGGEGIGRQIVEVIDIRETAPGHTELVVFRKVRADAVAAMRRRWAEGGMSCDGS